jgi:hypothetical protein
MEKELHFASLFDHKEKNGKSKMQSVFFSARGRLIDEMPSMRKSMFLEKKNRQRGFIFRR